MRRQRSCASTGPPRSCSRTSLKRSRLESDEFSRRIACHCLPSYVLCNVAVPSWLGSLPLAVKAAVRRWLSDSKLGSLQRTVHGRRWRQTPESISLSSGDRYVCYLWAQEMAARVALTLLAQRLGPEHEQQRARGLDMLLATLTDEASGWSPGERAAYLEAARPHMTAAEQVRPSGILICSAGLRCEVSNLMVCQPGGDSRSHDCGRAGEDVHHFGNA